MPLALASRHLSQLSFGGQRASVAVPRCVLPSIKQSRALYRRIDQVLEQKSAGDPFALRAMSDRTSSRPLSPLTYGKPIVMEPQGTHGGTMIMLHGLGDTGEGWADIGYMLAETLPHVKFIFPTAPKRSITLNWGMIMTGWYDIANLEDINQREDSEGLFESKRYVEGLVQEEVDKGLPSDKVVVAGFSQGGAVAMMMLRSELKLAGIIGLSTYLPLRTQGQPVSEVNKKVPIFLGHGDADQVVAYEYGRSSYNFLKELGMDVDFRTYKGMGHSANPYELEHVRQFVAKHLPPP